MSSEAVIVSGVGEAIATLEAPLSGRRCLLYQLELRRWQRWILDGWRRRPWRETVSSQFVLWSDDTPLLVDPAKAVLRLEVADRGHLVAEPICRRWGRPVTTTTLACVERRIESGERITVAGVVRQYPDAGGDQRGYRLSPTRTLVVAHAIRVH